MDLQNRTAVITGASRGIGAAMARVFAGAGLRLGLCARSAPVLPSGDRVVATRLDVADETAVDAFAGDVAQRFGPIDLWVNNAAVLEPVGPLRALSSADFRAHLDVNVLGVFHGTRAFVQHLHARGARLAERGGVLVNISSGAALRGTPGWSAYCAGKAAVDRLTECVALEERSAGLRAHAVAPGVVDTDMQAFIRGLSSDVFPPVEDFRRLKHEEALQRPEHVAEQLLALAFDPERRTDEVVLRLPPKGS